MSPPVHVVMGQSGALWLGDCRASMRAMIAEGTKAQMCVTSPPYFRLRDYGHQDQLGQEATPDDYVANLVHVFGLVRDLLADDGVLWLVIGDSYAFSGKGGGGSDARSGLTHAENTPSRHTAGLKPKDLIGIPWRVAFALQADGWYLRQDIIWSKPNAMPESVRDRCTASHEYVFLLSKRQHYFFDQDAIKEPASKGAAPPPTERAAGEAARSDKQRGHSRRHAGFNARWGAMNKAEQCRGMRNKRSVWPVAIHPYRGPHFAVYPPALIEPCILAGSRPGDIVLDPFIGSGTTGQVAQALGRRWIGCELNPDYVNLQNARTAQAGLVLA